MPDPNTSMKVEPEDITDAINKMGETVETMIVSQKKIAVQNEALVNKWEGSSCDSFLQAGISMENKYDDLIDALKKEMDILGRYKDSLINAEENAYNAFSLDVSGNAK